MTVSAGQHQSRFGDRIMLDADGIWEYKVSAATPVIALVLSRADFWAVAKRSPSTR